MKRKSHLAAIVAMSVCGVIGTTYAAMHQENDALGIHAAKLSLTQAIAAAERHVGGTASSAEFERHHGQGVYEVEVVKGGEAMDLRVDASNGAILEARADQDDRFGGHGDREEHDGRDD